MYDYLSQLHRMMLFTKEDVINITGNQKRASDLLSNYQQRGLVAKVRRNLYCVVNLASQMPEASKSQIATAVSPTAAVAYHAAMEYHGFAHQVFYEVAVVSDTRFNPFEFDGSQFVYYHNPISEGITNPISDSAVRVTDTERTVVDCIDRIDLSGGSEELANCLAAVRYLDENKLLRYLNCYDKAMLYKKVGCVLSLAGSGLVLTADFFSTCQNKSRHITGTLTAAESCRRYVAEWRLYLPEVMWSLLKQ